MPSPPKDRPSGRLGRLLAALRPSRAGPLPVQTGFPTSLADLVVKNHGRLKKQPSPSSNRRKRGAAASASPSPYPSTPTSPPPSPPPASPPPPPPAPAVAVSPSSDRPRPDLPLAHPPRRGKAGGFGLGFLAVSGVVSLALLVIWSKKVVAAVTVAAFSLYLLESVRPPSSSLPGRRRPRPAATETRRLCLEGRGRVSPIREVDAETEPSRPSCSDSDRASDASCFPDAAEESSGVLVLDESSNPTPKAKAKKKPWKKLLASAKKLHRGRRSKEPDSSGSSFRSDGDRADDASARGGNAKAADSSSGSFRGGAASQAVATVAKEAADSSMGSRRRSQGGVGVDAAAVEIDASVDGLIEEAEDEGEEEEQAGIRLPALVLVAIVLVGLVVGKVEALVLTVLCSAFLGSVQRSPYGGGGGGGGCEESQARRLELSTS